MKTMMINIKSMFTNHWKDYIIDIIMYVFFNAHDIHLMAYMYTIKV